MKKYIITGYKGEKRMRSAFVIDNEKSGDELWDSVNEAIDNYELQQRIQDLQNKGLKGDRKSVGRERV